MAQAKVWTAESTNDWNATIAAEFRANGGHVGGRFAGADLLILHTVGARSGEPRMTPLMYLPDGDRQILFATYAGNPKNPAWYHNLLAEPAITIELGTADGGVETFAARAVELFGAEREQLWERQVSLFPPFAKYREVSGRDIPLIAVTRS